MDQRTKAVPGNQPHVEIDTFNYMKPGCKVADMVHLDGADKKCLNNTVDNVASLVFRKPKWEYADNFAHSSNPTQARMAQAYEQEKAIQPAVKLAATTSRQQDTGKTNLDRQGQWFLEELTCEDTMVQTRAEAAHPHQS